MVPNSREKDGEYQEEGRIPGERENIREKGEYQGERRIAREGGNIKGGILGRGKNT